VGAGGQAGADGVALAVAEHSQQVVVLLDGEGAAAALPDVAAAVVLRVVSLLLGNRVSTEEQPHLRDKR
jgi:hypothetical protein